MHLLVPSKIVIEDSKVRESWIFTPENIEEKSRKFLNFIRKNITVEHFANSFSMILKCMSLFRYVCSECGKAYQEAQDMRLHMRKHTGK